MNDRSDHFPNDGQVPAGGVGCMETRGSLEVYGIVAPPGDVAGRAQFFRWANFWATCLVVRIRQTAVQIASGSHLHSHRLAFSESGAG